MPFSVNIFWRPLPLMPIASPEVDSRRRQLFFLGALLLLTLFSLWPIWVVDFPPLQDYPQHLFLAHVNATYADPSYNWEQYYLAGLRPGPYTLFYYAIVWLEAMMPVVVAGKVFLSCTIVLIAALVLSVAKRAQPGDPPWGTLLLFPLSFHQIYFMGFTNFLLSVPLLGLAVLDHQRLAQTERLGLALLRQAVMVSLLFLCHPFSILVYIVLTFGDGMLPGPDGGRRKLSLLPPLVTALLFAGWYVMTKQGSGGKMPLLWWPWSETVKYYLLMFTGMRWAQGIDWVSLVAWLAAAGLLLFGAIRATKRGVAFPVRSGLAFLLATAGFFILPFWAGQYSYFNLRMAPISYLFGALVAGFCALPLPAGLAITFISALLINQSAVVQRAVSNETAELKPILAAMRPNATILPMTFKTESAALDRHFFPEAHSHDHFYYHLLVGGGASPSLFPSPMLPVTLKPGGNLPLATHDFSWQDHGSKYDYILSRGAPEGFAPFVSRYAPLVRQSGEWLLFKNEHKK